jgi:hypothetical protein
VRGASGLLCLNEDQDAYRIEQLCFVSGHDFSVQRC